MLFQGRTVRIPVKLGLRQGCKLAPLLWVLFMDYMLTTLIPLTGDTWITQCMTLYADDIHVGCEFTSSRALDQHLHNIGCLLDVLEQLKLQLSYQKSHVLLSVTGSSSRRALKGRLSQQGSQRQMMIPRADGTKTALPLSSQSKYLGVVMSYHAFEELTWQHRKKSSWLAFHRLKPWLKTSRLDRNKRLYLWRICIHTIMTYGLMATNITVKILHEYQAVVVIACSELPSAIIHIVPITHISRSCTFFSIRPHCSCYIMLQ